MGRGSGGGGYEVVVAVEMDAAGAPVAALTMFFSAWPSSSHKSTWRMKKLASTRLPRRQLDSLDTKHSQRAHTLPGLLFGCAYR